MKLSARHAAIAQPVERILGKDEVAIKKPRTSKGFRLSYFLQGVVAIKETDTETDTGNFLAGQDHACPAVFMLVLRHPGISGLLS